MDRKGAAIHVDWAIAMGMFLISVITFLILLRPGVAPTTDTETLLSIVEDNFNNETMWSVRRIPLHVMKLDSKDPDSEVQPTITVKVTGEKRVGIKIPKKTWGFSKVEPPEVSQSAGTFQPSPPGGNIFTTTCSIATCDTKDLYGKHDYPFYLTVSQSAVDAPEPLFEFKCNAGSARCDGYLGSSEEIEGYNWDWISEIFENKNREGAYDNLKESWGYPLTSDFGIYVISEDRKFEGDIIKSPEIPQQANVRAKLIKSWDLHADGTKTPITISIRVW